MISGNCEAFERNRNIIISPLESVTDLDNSKEELRIVNVEDPPHGTAILNENKILYLPDPGFIGADTFKFVVSDGEEEPDFTIVVNTNNSAPVANSDTVSAYEDSSGEIRIGVTGNDSDPNGDPLLIESVTQPTNGTIEIQGLELVFRPIPNFNGIETFDYTISDGDMRCCFRRKGYP